MRFTLTYGSDKLKFSIGDNFLSSDQPFIEPRRVKPEIKNVEDTINRALSNPVNSRPLKELVKARSVALVVSDEFRAGQQEMIIKCLLKEIAAGRPSKLNVLCATGSHEPDVYAFEIKKWVEKYSAEFNQPCSFYPNNCDAKSDFITIGGCSDGTPIDVNKYYLETEVRVYGHEGKHHYMNGYSCIDKQVLPGISSRRSIEGNHKNALDDVHSVAGRNVWVEDASRRNNPFSKGIFEARLKAESVILRNGRLIEEKAAAFGLDMISDKEAVYWAEAGDPAIISTHMTAEADRQAAFTVRPERYVVISPGGPPASQALYGVQNCFDLALAGSIEDGGEALVVAPCEGRPDLPDDVKGLAPDSKAKELFWDNLSRLKDRPLKEAAAWIEANFELYLWKTDRVLKLMNGRKVKIYLYSKLSDEKARSGGFIPCHDISAWVSERAGRGDGRFRVIDDGNKILVMGQ